MSRHCNYYHVIVMILFCFVRSCCFFIFFFNDTATTEIYTLSLHDALPIWRGGRPSGADRADADARVGVCDRRDHPRSEEHTSELQSHVNLVCRLLLEKKKKTDYAVVSTFYRRLANEHDLHVRSLRRAAALP